MWDLFRINKARQSPTLPYAWWLLVFFLQIWVVCSGGSPTVHPFVGTPIRSLWAQPWLLKVNDGWRADDSRHVGMFTTTHRPAIIDSYQHVSSLSLGIYLPMIFWAATTRGKSLVSLLKNSWFTLIYLLTNVFLSAGGHPLIHVKTQKKEHITSTYMCFLFFTSFGWNWRNPKIARSIHQHLWPSPCRILLKRWRNDRILPSCSVRYPHFPYKRQNAQNGNTGNTLIMVG